MSAAPTHDVDGVRHGGVLAEAASQEFDKGMAACWQRSASQEFDTERSMAAC
jgi:hypothetical protein